MLQREIVINVAVYSFCQEELLLPAVRINAMRMGSHKHGHDKIATMNAATASRLTRGRGDSGLFTK